MSLYARTIGLRNHRDARFGAGGRQTVSFRAQFPDIIVFFGGFPQKLRGFWPRAMPIGKPIRARFGLSRRARRR